MEFNDINALSAARRKIGITGRAKTIWPRYPHPVPGIKLLICACAGELDETERLISPNAVFGSILWAINEYFPCSVDMGASMIANTVTPAQKDFAALVHISGVFSVQLALRSLMQRRTFPPEDAPYLGVIYLAGRSDIKGMGVALRKAGLI